jgi:CRAL/TRIO domain
MIIIRAPSIFRYAWAVAKNCFRQSMRKKMIFASKNYLEVLDEFIPRNVLPPSIVEGGLGCVAMGMPPLIGDLDDHQLSRTKVLRTKEEGKTIYSPFENSYSIAETDDSSTASDDDGSWNLSSSTCSVSSRPLCAGVWFDQDAGGSEIFLKAVA